MKNSRVSLLVTLVLLGSFAFAQKQTVTWKEYVFVNDGYAITLPEAPNPHPDSTLPEMTVYSVSVQPNTRLSLRVSHQDRDCGATLAQLKGGALKGNSGIDPASVTDVYVDGHPGLEYRYSHTLKYTCGCLTACTWESVASRGSSERPTQNR